MPGKSMRRGDIETIRRHILATHLSRLIVFSDVINRYLHLRMKDDKSWLRVSTVLFIITRGGETDTYPACKPLAPVQK